MNFLDTDLYERQGKAVSNFDLTLPAPQSDLAQAITRDPYTFDFLTLRESYDEKELKDALMDNITKFLLELGNGFAFVGREYRLEILWDVNTGLKSAIPVTSSTCCFTTSNFTAMWLLKSR